MTFYYSVQNDGNTPDVFAVRGGRSSTHFTVRYYRGNVEVTNRIVNGTYGTPTLDPGEDHRLRAVVTVRQSAPVGASLTRSLRASATKRAAE